MHCQLQVDRLPSFRKLPLLEESDVDLEAGTSQLARLCLTLIEITGDGCIGYILPDHWLIGNHFQEIPGKSELGLQSKQREPSFQGGEHCLAPSTSSASLRTQTDPDS
ncbi:hypothetical protein PGT21_004648 [Puccinia graminis f. sp. tritici]|uniref:Uncharacterized protein n=1 Tax=Puccinia graminis f. sp. tritici TaxID=56615 RepID=A0A5B0PQP9_PUCGR|nr:hypothetical protein PGT21_004648 [Puccinia graminis f. sp. tritici]